MIFIDPTENMVEINYQSYDRERRNEKNISNGSRHEKRVSGLASFRKRDAKKWQGSWCSVRGAALITVRLFWCVESDLSYACLAQLDRAQPSMPL